MASVLSVVADVRLMYFHYRVRTKTPLHKKREGNKTQQRSQHVNMLVHIIVFGVIFRE